MTLERTTQWNYPLLGVSENRMAERTGTPSKDAFEMIGADFSIKGGVRPFPGFKKIHSFTNLDDREVVDFFPISFRVGINQYGYGFVYKVKQTVDGTLSDIYLDYYVKGFDEGNFQRKKVIKESQATADPMDVAVFGKYVYITQRGMETVLFLLEFETPAQATSVLTITDNSAIQSVDTAATGTIEFTGVATEDTTITLIDHAGTSKTYIAKSSGANGDVVTGGITFLNIGDKNDNASALKDAIAHGNGHNGTIVAVWSAGTGNVGLTQSAVGASGNTAIASDLDNCTVSDAFTGGGLITKWESLTAGWYALQLSCGASNAGFYVATFIKGATAEETATNIKTAVDLTAVESTVTVERTDNVLTFTQVSYGKGGNNPVTLTGNTWATKSNFSGGSGPTPSDTASLSAYRTHITQDTGPGTRPLLLGVDDQTAILGLGDPTSPSEGNAHLFTGTEVGSYWDTTPTDQVTPASLDAGGYSVGYILEDPLTGRRTALSEIASIKQSDLTSKATGRLTVLTGTPTNFDPGTGEKLTIADSIDGENGNTVIFEFSNTHTSSAKLTNTHYLIGIKDLGTAVAIAGKIYDAIALAKENKDLDITAVDPETNAYIDLTHDKATTDGNEDIVFDGDVEDLTITGMSGASNFDPGYMGLEIIWPYVKYSKAYIYRSVKIQDAGGSYAGSVIQLDKIITLDDYTTTDQTGISGSNRRAIYYFTKQDLTLLYMPPYSDRSLFDAEMPKAGACIEFDGIMLTSNATGTSTSSSEQDLPDDRYRGVGEFRWSSIRETSPELFPPENYFTPSKIANEVITFEKSGGAVLGFANNVIMHITRETTGVISYLKILPIHEGYGIVNKNASVTVGPQTVYINDKTVKSIDAQGRLDTLHALDGIINDWQDDLADYVSMGFDAQSLTLYLLNSNKKQAAVMWFGTSSVSEIYDLPFDLVKTGSWYSKLSDVDSSLTEYAMFLQNLPGTNSDFDPCVWVVDSKRERTISGSSSSDFNGEPRITLLDGIGDTRFKVISWSSTTGLLSLDGSTLQHQDVAPILDSTPANWAGAYVYVLDEGNILSPDNVVGGLDTLKGGKAQIESVSLTATTAGHIEFTGSGVITEGKIITLISTDGTSKTYIADTVSGDNGELDESGRVKFFNGGDKNDHAQILTGVIVSGNGHNGKITATWTPGTGNITLGQATAGASGNSTITSNLNDCTITQFSGATTKLSLINESANFNVAGNGRIAISPVYVRWSGSLLGYNDSVTQQSPTPGGLQKVRLVDSLSAFFSSVGGSPTLDTVNTADIFYKGIIFEGDSDTYKSQGIPKDLSGTIVKSIVNGESANWAAFETHGVRGMALSPGLEVFCPDLDFRLLSVIIDGKVMSTLRTERAT